MGIGVSSGENRASEAAKKAVSSPLLEVSVDGAKGVLMNITGGSNLSLYEVQEAADIVASASDEDVNMIFGSVINDNLKDEIIVTVIATGFNEEQLQPRTPRGSGLNSSRVQSIQQQTPQQQPSLREARREEQQQRREEQIPSYQQEPQRTEKPQQDDALDIPTFLRNRRRR